MRARVLAFALLLACAAEAQTPRPSPTNGGAGGGGGGSGTVTSVSGPSIFTWANATSTPTATINSQTQNVFLASPNGSSGTPTFRALVVADLPTSIPNANLANTATTVNGQTCTLGSTCTVTAAPSGSAGGSLGGSYPNPSIVTSVALPGSPTTTTQTQNDNSTKVATTAYTDLAVANAVAGINPAVAVNAATTSASDTSGFTYNNGASGIGATFTGTINTAVTIDGFTFTTVGQRLLVKNDTQSPSGAFNGVYSLSVVQTSLLAPVFTRALDYDAPSDINSTGAIPVVSGTVNTVTSWLLTSAVATVGTSPLTYAQFSANPSSAVTSLTGDTTGTASGGAIVTTTSKINGTAFSGTLNDAVLFGASNTPKDSGALYNSACGSFVCATGTLSSAQILAGGATTIIPAVSGGIIVVESGQFNMLYGGTPYTFTGTVAIDDSVPHGLTGTCASALLTASANQYCVVILAAQAPVGSATFINSAVQIRFSVAPTVGNGTLQYWVKYHVITTVQ